MFGLGSGHDAERGHQFDGQHALTGRNDPHHFGGITLGALEHGLHLVHGRRNNGQRERPLALGEQLVHIGIGAGELEGLGGVRLFLGCFLFLGRLPLGRGLDDILKGGVHLGFHFSFGKHADGMGNDDETHVRQPLTFLGAAGKGQKLVGCDGYRGNAHFLKITLVNYQP